MQRSAIAVGAGSQQLDRARLGEALLRFGDLDPDAVAGQRPGDEDDEALGAGDAAPAEGERVDLDLEQLAATRAAGRRLLAGGLLHLAEFLARAARRLGGLFAHRLGPAADLFAGLFDQPFEFARAACRSVCGRV